MKILFPCTVGCLDSSDIEIKEKIKAHSFKNYLSCLDWCEYHHAHAIFHVHDGHNPWYTVRPTESVGVGVWGWGGVCVRGGDDVRGCYDTILVVGLNVQNEINEIRPYNPLPPKKACRSLNF